MIKPRTDSASKHQAWHHHLLFAIPAHVQIPEQQQQQQTQCRRAQHARSTAGLPASSQAQHHRATRISPGIIGSPTNRGFFPPVVRLLFPQESHCPVQSVCSLVGFSQGLSAIIQYFPLTTNQHQSSLSAQKPTSEQAEYLSRRRPCFSARGSGSGIVVSGRPLFSPLVHRP